MGHVSEVDDQLALARVLPREPVWIDVGNHVSVGWSCRKAAEMAHVSGCGQACQPFCGAASELLGIAGVKAFTRGDLIAPLSGVLSLGAVMSLVSFGIGASCGAIVVDDLGTLIRQHPSPRWWANFALAADASTADGVTVLLLAAPQDLDRWPAGLPRPSCTLQGHDWWVGSYFGTPREVHP
jgi:hypothetical protein